MRLKFYHRISVRQAVNTLIIALFVGIFLSVVQIVNDFRKEQDQIKSFISPIMNMSKNLATLASVSYNKTLSDNIINGMLQYEPFYMVQIINNFGMVIGEGKKLYLKGKLNWLTGLFDIKEEYKLDLFEKEQPVGSLYIVIDKYIIAKNFINRSLLLIFGNFIFSFILAFILTLRLYYYLTQPILKIVHDLLSVDLAIPADKLIEVPKGHNKDELSLLVKSSNQLLNGFEESLSIRRIAEETLEEQNRALLKLDKLKDNFLANMSHEIRTPMNAIIGLSGLALLTDLSPKQRDYLYKIESSSKSLLGVINDILDFSKIEAGKLDMEAIDFNINNILNSLSDLISIKAEEKGIKVIFKVEKGVPLNLVGDPLRLSQVLINLSNNAIKFTKTGQIIIQVEEINNSPYQTSEEVMLQFSIEDSGIGMTKQQIENLFQPFTQADGSTTRKYGGTGLGLAICKKLVEMMDGHIHVKSELGYGSVFTFTAKFRRQSKEKQKSVTSSFLEIDALHKIKGAKILLVEDNEINQQVAKEILEIKGFLITIANNGLEAIDQLKRSYLENTPFDAVLMDIQMPIMDGYTATKEIRNDSSEIKDVPIIAMTAHAMKNEKERCLKDGMNDYVTKPIEPKHLYSVLAKWIKPYEREVFISEEKDKGEIYDIELPESLPGLHVTAGVNRIGGNKKLYIKLLKGLNEKYQNSADELRNALEKKEFELINRIAHTMKGVAGNIGADKLAKASKELESVLKENRMEVISTTIKQFDQALHEVLDSAKQLINLNHAKLYKDFLPIKELSEIDLKLLKPLLIELRELLEQGQSRAKDVLESIQKHLRQTEFRNLLLKIESFIDNYDFEEAGKVLANLMENELFKI